MRCYVHCTLVPHFIKYHNQCIACIAIVILVPYETNWCCGSNHARVKGFCLFVTGNMDSSFLCLEANVDLETTIEFTVGSSFLCLEVSVGAL
jgi:hypothetical protein